MSKKIVKKVGFTVIKFFVLLGFYCRSVIKNNDPSNTVKLFTDRLSEDEIPLDDMMW